MNLVMPALKNLLWVLVIAILMVGPITGAVWGLVRVVRNPARVKRSQPRSDGAMPDAVVVASVLVALSILQGLVNMSAAVRATGTWSAQFVLDPAAVSLLLVGLVRRQNWVRWVFVAVALVSFSPIQPFLRWLPAWVSAGVGTGYVQSALHLVACILLLLPVSVRWFGRERRPKG